MTKYLLAIIMLLISPLISLSSSQLTPDEIARMSLRDMMNVEIETAGKKPEKIEEIPASVVIITRNDIERFGYNNIEEVLNNIPGLFSINDYDPWGSYSGVRGFWSNFQNRNIIILINGIQQVENYSSTQPEIRMSLPVEIIEKIEIIRGPMSVLYGSGAMLGVINIITKNQAREEDNQLVTISAGYPDTYRAALRVNGKSSDNSFTYSFNAGYINDIGIQGRYSDLCSSISPNWNISSEDDFDGQLELDNKYFDFTGTYKNFTVGFIHNINYSEGMFLFPNHSNSEGLNSRMTSTDVLMEYNENLTDNLSFKTRLNMTKTNSRSEFEYFFDDFYGIQQIESEAYEAEFDLFYKMFSNCDLTFGIVHKSITDIAKSFDLPSFQNPGLENTKEYLNDDDLINRAVYLQANWQIQPQLSLVAGLRFDQSPEYALGKQQVYVREYTDSSGFPASEIMQLMSEGYYSHDEIEIIPRLALLYGLNDNNVFKLLYGEAINRPSFFQNIKNLSDPIAGELSPEKIRTIELNYIGNISKQLNLSISIFRNILDNLITRIVKVEEDGSGYRTWSGNAGELITNGFEVSVKANPIGNLFTDLSFTFQNTVDKREGYEDIEPAYSPHKLGYFKLYYLFDDVFSIAFSANYVDAMESFFDETILNSDSTYGARIGDKVDEYINCSLNFRVNDILFDGMYFNFKIYNLLDTEIRYPTFTNNTWTDKGTIGAGRIFVLSSGYYF